MSYIVNNWALSNLLFLTLHKFSDKIVNIFEKSNFDFLANTERRYVNSLVLSLANVTTLSTDLPIAVNFNVKGHDWYTCEESICVTYEYIMMLIKRRNLLTILIHSGPCVDCYEVTVVLYAKHIRKPHNYVNLLKKNMLTQHWTLIKIVELW